MLGLATSLLDALKRGSMRRGREVTQLDIGYPESTLAMERPERHGGVLAGDRAPDAPMRGAGGQPVRLFALLQGPHWTLMGYETAQQAVAARPNLQVHLIGSQGDIIDDDGHFRAAYGLSAGDWVLVRPDGYVGAIVAAAEIAALEIYLANTGLGLKGGAHG